MAFKLNRIWLEDPGFVEMVKSFWKSDVGGSQATGRRSLGAKLRSLKAIVKMWEKNKKEMTKAELNF